MGLATLGSMLVPIEAGSTGLLFDLRAPLLATAGFIGGPAAAAIACAFALAFRIHVGGLDTIAGCGSIVVAGIVGTTGHLLGRRHRAGVYDLPLFAAAVAASVVLTTFLLPRADWGAGFRYAGLMAVINFGCAWLFPLSLLRDQHLHSLVDKNGIYRAIFDALPDSLNAKDSQSRFLAANPATAYLMRAESPESLLGKTDADFYLPEIAHGFRQDELGVLDGHTLGPTDEEVAFIDGSIRSLTTLKTPLRDRHGKVCGIITHNRDVTDRKSLEADLLKTQGYLHEAMTNMADGLVLYDRHGTIRFCNQQYGDLFPLTKDLRVVGGHLSDILRAAVLRGEERAPDDLEAWIAERMQARQQPGDRIVTLSDGRTIEARSRRVAGTDILVVFNDVTRRQQHETELLRRATHDSLTGLANRAEFELRLAAARDRAIDDGLEIGVVMMDLDRFKQVNDRLGHAAGDTLLIEVARRMRAAIRADDVAARLGGDEFAFLVSGPDATAATQALADRILQSFDKPLLPPDLGLDPGTSLGIAAWPRDAADPSQLLNLADRALYAAKRCGGGRWASAADLIDANLASGRDSSSDKAAA